MKTVKTYSTKSNGIRAKLALAAKYNYNPLWFDVLKLVEGGYVITATSDMPAEMIKYVSADLAGKVYFNNIEEPKMTEKETEVTANEPGDTTQPTAEQGAIETVQKTAEPKPEKKKREKKEPVPKKPRVLAVKHNAVALKANPSTDSGVCWDLFTKHVDLQIADGKQTIELPGRKLVQHIVSTFGMNQVSVATHLCDWKRFYGFDETKYILHANYAEKGLDFVEPARDSKPAASEKPASDTKKADE